MSPVHSDPDECVCFKREHVESPPDLEYTCPPQWVRDCTCGSGGHPRRCAKHPEAFAEHCRQLTEDWCEP